MKPQIARKKCAGIFNLSLQLTLEVILGALAKVQNATISSVVCLSVCMKQLGSHCTDFDETWYLSFFRKCVQKIQVSLKPNRNNGYFT
jgi:hypothetical protein